MNTTKNQQPVETVPNMEQYAVTCVFFIDKEKEINSVSRVERYVRDYLVDTDKLNGNEGFQIVQTEEINEQE